MQVLFGEIAKPQASVACGFAMGNGWCRMMKSLLRDLLQLVRSWWRVDRVRTASSEGQLLRLSSPCVLGIAGRWWVVESRTVGDGAQGAFVHYHCCDGGVATGELEVRPPPPFGSGSIHWTWEDRVVELHPTEIEVFAPLG
jgi:hypothetical protein